MQGIPLGKTSPLPSAYDPGLLFPIARATKRDELGIAEPLPFYGEDIWNAYELSWLNARGKPVVAIAEFRLPAHSPNLIESKSFKLYLNSLNQHRFEHTPAVQKTLEHDLSQACGARVTVILSELTDFSEGLHAQLPGICLDHLDIEVDDFAYSTHTLKANPRKIVQETLCSDLLKSNCLVTGQPDWGSVQIAYTGPQIDREGLLRYLISFRQHEEFHEQCVERIFTDISWHCHPQHLTVYARYTRRGGLDINPFRSSDPKPVCPNIRLMRQ